MIETESLTVQYGNQMAVRDASVTIPKGQITAIVGPSGCGKSSFLNALNRMTDLIPGAHVSGQTRLDGTDVRDRRWTPDRLRQHVGMIFQRPQPFPMSIAGNIKLALREHGVRDRNKLDRITQQSLQDVGLWDEVKDRLTTPALQLSGGQQQRLCIARALALRPQVLLMDEPCSALDPIAAAKVESLITRLRGDYTLVIVTHNLAQARRIADQLIVFWWSEGAGQVIAQGPAHEIWNDPGDPIARQYLSGQQG